jgi:membrane-bound serine protease (ClpP class)
MRPAGRKLFVLLAAIMIISVAVVADLRAQEVRTVGVATVDGIINTLTAKYLERAIKKAEKDGASALVIELDTPGGEVEAMREMIRDMFAAPMPVIVFVYPPGGRAGSAGVFITLAGDVAAMSAGTNIGAAHPVGGGGQDIEGELGKKITNDMAAFIRTIAEKRGRNKEWAEKAVRESVSVTEEEAMELGIIDFIAQDVNDLLRKADGQVLSADRGGQPLQLQPASIKRIPMNLQEKLIHFVINPNIAYLLLTIGIVGVIAELYNPGTLAPGLIGGISIILFLIATSVLPINWGGLTLIILAVVMFILEVNVTSYGLLTMGGIVIFVLGSAMLFREVTPEFPLMPSLSVSPWLIASLTATASAFFFFVVRAIVMAQRMAPSPVESSLVGAEGIAKSKIGLTGTAQVQGELWTAQAEQGEIEEGKKIVVKSIEGLKLQVREVAENERREP